MQSILSKSSTHTTFLNKSGNEPSSNQNPVNDLTLINQLTLTGTKILQREWVMPLYKNIWETEDAGRQQNRE